MGIQPGHLVGLGYAKAEAQRLDQLDSLQHLRREFIIPTKDDLTRGTLMKEKDSANHDLEEACIYLCGNSLGLQPRRTADRVATHLTAWATKGVFGHFKAHADSNMPAFVDIDEVAAERMAPIVGASAKEVAITAHAHSHGINIGWDLAHAVGNVELDLHDWDVDFAVWCSYKYLNCGPGAIAGLFVHERHGRVLESSEIDKRVEFRPRLSGWWGGDKAARFQMGNHFTPIPGAAGFQVGNPSALAICPLLASLEVFQQTTMKDIRSKSVMLTNYLEHLLRQGESGGVTERQTGLFQIITPSDPSERGAQLSIRLKSGLLEDVMASLEEHGIVVDERRPDVVRVAPAPLYNTFSEVWEFVDVFNRACINANIRSAELQDPPAALAGSENKGWSHIK
ncbi:MAG: hypothetical protein Q9219_005215 [cf. Caloplaca sp. 3 TL-2023]